MDFKPAKGKVVVSVDMQLKNSHNFADGTTIRLERQFDNFNRRYTQVSQGEVVASEYIPVGATVLIHHNATHDTHRIFNFKSLSGTDIASDIKYFSIPEEQCYLWRLNGEAKPFNSYEWQPMKGFVTGLRVFKPYEGFLQGIKPTKIKNVLFIKMGEFKDKVVHTLHAADYELIFQNEHGREERIIRCRHFENEYHEREEITATDETLTEQVLNGELLIGLSDTTAKPLKEIEYV